MTLDFEAEIREEHAVAFDMVQEGINKGSINNKDLSNNLFVVHIRIHRQSGETVDWHQLYARSSLLAMIKNRTHAFITHQDLPDNQDWDKCSVAYSCYFVAHGGQERYVTYFHIREANCSPIEDLTYFNPVHYPCPQTYSNISADTVYQNEDINPLRKQCQKENTKEPDTEGSVQPRLPEIGSP